MKKSIVLMLLIGCSGTPPADPTSVHQDAQSLWSESAPAAYEYDIEGIGFSPNDLVTVAVEAGEATSSHEYFAKTVEQLFDDVAGDMSSDQCVVEIEYDPTYGYPQKIYVDCGEEGSGWEITRFEAR